MRETSFTYFTFYWHLNPRALPAGFFRLLNCHSALKGFQDWNRPHPQVWCWLHGEARAELKTTFLFIWFNLTSEISFKNILSALFIFARWWRAVWPLLSASSISSFLDIQISVLMLSLFVCPFIIAWIKGVAPLSFLALKSAPAWMRSCVAGVESFSNFLAWSLFFQVSDPDWQTPWGMQDTWWRRVLP